MLTPMKDRYKVIVQYFIQIDEDSVDRDVMQIEVDMPAGDVPKVGDETSWGKIVKVIGFVYQVVA